MWLEPRAFDLVNDELVALCGMLDVQTMPAVIGMAERYDNDRKRFQALADARLAMRRRGVIDADGELDPDLSHIIRTLGVPEWTVEMRRVDRFQTLRICLAAAGERRVRAVRSGEQITLDVCDSADDGALLVSSFGTPLGQTAGADIDEIRLPSDEFITQMADCRNALDYAEALFALGVSEGSARRTGLVLENCCGQSEIVLRTNYISRPAVVSVLDTSYGRLVTEMSASVAGEWWTSMAPGDHFRVTAAIRRLAHNLPQTIPT